MTIRTHEEDAHNALCEAIENRGRLRMTIPANPEGDTDLRIARALSELRELTLILSRVKLALEPNGDEPPQNAEVRATFALTLIKSYEENNR